MTQTKLGGSRARVMQWRLGKLCGRIEELQHRLPPEAQDVRGYLADAKARALEALRAAEKYE